MNPEKTLVVVDMQKGAALSRYHGCYLNKQWWERHARVCALIQELAGCISDALVINHTAFRKNEHREVFDEMRLVQQRARKILWKDEDDGSDVLEPHLRKENAIYVVGMNTDACILRTARGLRRRFFDVSVIKDACFSAYYPLYPNSHYDALYRLRKVYDVPTLHSNHFLAKWLLQDLARVGHNKPMGYLPVPTIKQYCCSSVDAQIRRARKYGLKWCIENDSPNDSDRGMDFFYVYDPYELEGLLQKKKDVLLKAEWPTNPRAFIKKVVLENAPPYTELYDLIADAFGDQANPRRSEYKDDRK